MQRGLGVYGRVAGGQQQMVALAQGEVKLLGEAEDRLPARLGAAVLYEAQVPGRDPRLQGELELTQAPVAPPPAQQLADWTPVLACSTHPVLTMPDMLHRRMSQGYYLLGN